MTRYVIGPDVAIRLAHDQAVIRGGHQVLAPALLRSQVLSLLYQAVRRGEMTRKDAERQLEYVRGLRIRLLGDRVLQNVAWKAAGLLGWPDTFDAEYVALTQLHADALITLDRHLADAVKDLVTIAPIEALYGPKRALRAALPRELLIRNEGDANVHIYAPARMLTRGSADTTEFSDDCCAALSWFWSEACRVCTSGSSGAGSPVAGRSAQGRESCG